MNTKQSTRHILMIRPSSFYKNEQTAVNNYYQRASNLSQEETTVSAQKEFDEFVKKLRKNNIHVIVHSSVSESPDVLFPNNWVSFHGDGRVVLYPMFAENRRSERCEKVSELIGTDFEIKNILDITSEELEGLYLEGTGSMVLDRIHRKSYIAISPRTEESVARKICENLGYTPVFFRANQTVGGERLPIYHTNVMMSIASNFVLICLDSIDDENKREELLNHFESGGREVIQLDEEDIKAFSGNALEVRNDSEKILVMSTQGYQQLSASKRKRIENYVRIVHSPLDTIEMCGGGSARCMMAEVFLPKKTR